MMMRVSPILDYIALIHLHILYGNYFSARLFRDMLLTRPTIQLIKYGNLFGQRTSQLIQQDQSYVDGLNRDYKHVYSNGAIELYPLK